MENQRHVDVQNRVKSRVRNSNIMLIALKNAEKIILWKIPR